MDQRTILAIVLSFFLLIGYQTYLSTLEPPPEEIAEQAAQEAPAPGAPFAKAATGGKEITPPDGNLAPAKQTAKRQMLAENVGATVNFENDLLTGEISLKGGRLVDVRFKKFLDVQGPDGKPIVFMKYGDGYPFYNESGFISVDNAKVPGRDTEWTLARHDKRADGGTIQLTWNNGQGQTFNKNVTYTNGSYLFQVDDQVVNRSGSSLFLHHYSQFSRVKEPPKDTPTAMGPSESFIDFIGPIGFLDDKRVETEYDDLRQQDVYHHASTGWAGFADMNFMGVIIPPVAESPRKFYFDYDAPAHRVGEIGGKIEVAGGNQASLPYQLYIGPKEVRGLDKAGLELHRALDYGWFHFLARPLMQVMLFLNDYLGNWGLTIIMLTVLIKLLFFPLANKSYSSMNAMKKLQPEVTRLKELYKDDKQRMNEETMKLYQEKKVNPLGGCLPMVIQIPVFFALYKCLFLSIEMRHTPFFGWVTDLSDKDPYYILPVLMGASMFLQQKMNPAPADPTQAKVMMLLPIIFTAMFLSFPSGLVLYWLVNNILSIAQQGYIAKSQA